MLKRCAALLLLFVFASSAFARGWPRVNDAVRDAAERKQVLATLALIDRGGPFPYARDGIVFANREHRLPSQRRGYYREYTVPTPGARNRGARRIIRGEGGETYYTRDHYRSFVRLDR
jgi:ribonuclease T1